MLKISWKRIILKKYKAFNFLTVSTTNTIINTYYRYYAILENEEEKVYVSNFEEAENIVNTLKDKIETIDDKGKFDIREFFKKYFPWIVVVIGIGVYAVSNFVKF